MVLICHLADFDVAAPGAQLEFCGRRCAYYLVDLAQTGLALLFFREIIYDMALVGFRHEMKGSVARYKREQTSAVDLGVNTKFFFFPPIIIKPHAAVRRTDLSLGEA